MQAPPTPSPKPIDPPLADLLARSKASWVARSSEARWTTPAGGTSSEVVVGCKVTDAGCEIGGEVDDAGQWHLLRSGGEL